MAKHSANRGPAKEAAQLAVVDPKILPTAFSTVTKMEDPLQVAVDLANGLSLIALTINDQNTSLVIQRLSWLIKDSVDAAEELRGHLFHMTHAANRHKLATTRADGNYGQEGGAA